MTQRLQVHLDAPASENDPIATLELAKAFSLDHSAIGPFLETIADSLQRIPTEQTETASTRSLLVDVLMKQLSRWVSPPPELSSQAIQLLKDELPTVSDAAITQVRTETNALRRRGLSKAENDIIEEVELFLQFHDRLTKN